MGNKRPPKDFEERILHVVRNFVEYGYYGKDARRAIRNIRGHFPSLSEADCATAFHSFEGAWREAIVFLGEHAVRLGNGARLKEALPSLAEDFAARHPGLSAEALGAMLRFIHDWHHVR